MLKIRLQRTGRKHEPTFRVVLTDSRNSTKSGKYLENLGWYDTRLQNKKDQLKIDRIKYWMSYGAGLSVTLHNFLVSQKAIEGKKINALPKKHPIKPDKPGEKKVEPNKVETPVEVPAVETPIVA